MTFCFSLHPYAQLVETFVASNQNILKYNLNINAENMVKSMHKTAYPMA